MFWCLWFHARLGYRSFLTCFLDYSQRELVHVLVSLCFCGQKEGLGLSFSPFCWYHSLEATHHNNLFFTSELFISQEEFSSKTMQMVVIPQTSSSGKWPFVQNRKVTIDYHKLNLKGHPSKLLFSSGKCTFSFIPIRKKPTWNSLLLTGRNSSLSSLFYFRTVSILPLSVIVNFKGSLLPSRKTLLLPGRWS